MGSHRTCYSAVAVALHPQACLHRTGGAHGGAGRPTRVGCIEERSAKSEGRGASASVHSQAECRIGALFGLCYIRAARWRRQLGSGLPAWNPLRYCCCSAGLFSCAASTAAESPRRRAPSRGDQIPRTLSRQPRPVCQKTCHSSQILAAFPLSAPPPGTRVPEPTVLGGVRSKGVRSTGTRDL